MPAARVSERVIGPSDEEWPERLRDMTPLQPPARLYAIGRGLSLGELPVAIVGTRRPTLAGLEMASKLASSLAEAGCVVVSGLAVGIDAAAHRACVRAGGTTVAVVGCGLDLTYPAKNLKLRREIEQSGTVVSEYPSGTQPQKSHFPARNRLIAGLCRAAVIVEGGLKSGALITARFALDAGRDVYAVPGSSQNNMASGPNELIRTGQAGLVTEVRHIFEETLPSYVWDRPVQESLGGIVGLDENEQAILSVLDDVPSPVDRIARAAGLAPGKASLAIAGLEIRGLAHRRNAAYLISATGARVRSHLP